MTVAAFDWSEPLPWAGPGAIDGVVEDLAGDRLGRARYAEFLSNYLAAEGKQRNYVLNLNAEWGAGKTWFIKRWYMELKECYGRCEQVPDMRSCLSSGAMEQGSS
ncbi:KAP family NTPase [Aeromonas caviae]|nr:KAP family NTPase [Aeromonas caviae]MDH0936684.1 KAP family NTPase [Aeromonas caviae]MDH1397494.1 KAP family NTPase [Aeromonas caviae]